MLSLFARVRPSEVVALLLLTANVMLLLGSYYLLKTAREPLILQGGAAVKTYASAAQALLLIPVAHLFGVLAGRMPRLRLMAAVTGLLRQQPAGVLGAAGAGVPIGVPFYIWVGVFNMAVIAQFWTYVAGHLQRRAGPPPAGGDRRGRRAGRPAGRPAGQARSTRWWGWAACS